jgi:hypothetical protein
VATGARVALKRGVDGGLSVCNSNMDSVSCILSALEDFDTVMVKVIEAT